MAWLIKDKRTGKWNVRWYENGRICFKATGTKDRKRANQKLVEIEKTMGVPQPEHLTLSELYDRRTAYLKIDGAENSILREEGAYKAFRAFLGAINPTGTPSLGVFDDYKAYRRSSGVSDGTINGDLKHLQAMFNWGSKRGYCDSINIPKIRLNESQPVFLEEEEIRSFFQAIEELKPTCPKYLSRLGDDFWRDYWRMIFELYFQTGARRDEIADLKWEDVDFKRSEITLKNTKGKRDRTIPLTGDLLGKLRKFEEGGMSQVCLHSGRRNLNVYKRYALAAGIKDPAKLKIHVIRHTVASHMNMKGFTLETIRDILGHRKIMTTTIYTHANREHHLKAIQSLPWIEQHNTSA
jgi:integrase